MKFTIPIEPIACPRPRVGKFGTYYPKKYQDWRKAASRLLPIGAITKQDGPVIVSMSFRHSVPSSYSKKLRRQLVGGSSERWPRPDTDNQIKALWDLLNGIAWNDDSQVVTLHARKLYAEEAGIDVEILPVTSGTPLMGPECCAPESFS